MRPAGLLRLAVASLIVCASAASAQDALIDLGNKGARVSRARGAGRLAQVGPSHVETLRAFLRARHDETTLRDLVQTREHVSSGVLHQTYGQRVGGLDVYGTYAGRALPPTASCAASSRTSSPPPAPCGPPGLVPRRRSARCSSAGIPVSVPTCLKNQASATS